MILPCDFIAFTLEFRKDILQTFWANKWKDVE